MIGGGTWEGAHVRHEAAGVRQPARRRGGGVAGGGAAQQGERMRRVGVLIGAAVDADDPDVQANIAAFLQGLQQLGWTDGRNVRIDYRWGAGNADNIRKHAAELVALAPDVILATGTAAMAPLLQATRTLPIVFTAVADPVGAGFVDSLARPGGNTTGFMQFEYNLSGKWLELLKQIVPEPDAGGNPSGCGHILRDRPVRRDPVGGAVVGR